MILRNTSKKREDWTINTKSITRGALAIALIVVSFSIFKGVTNIFNAFLVPIALHLGTLGTKRVEKAAVFGLVFLLCFLFFKLQMFFLLIYFFVAVLLSLLLKYRTWISVSFLTIANSIGFFVGILLTDLLLSTHMFALLMGVLGNNVIAYAGILLFEGAIVSVGQLFLARKMEQRIKKGAAIV